MQIASKNILRTILLQQHCMRALSTNKCFSENIVAYLHPISIRSPDNEHRYACTCLAKPLGRVAAPQSPLCAGPYPQEPRDVIK